MGTQNTTLTIPQQHFTIRQARPEDAEAIFAMSCQLAEFAGKKPNERNMQAGILTALRGNTADRFLLAFRGRIPVGQLMISPMWDDWDSKNCWWIRRIFIPARYRGQGILDAMFDHVGARAVREKVTFVQLVVDERNPVAKRAYSKRGWTANAYRMVMPLPFAV